MKHPWLFAPLLVLLMSAAVTAGERTPPSPPASAKCAVCGMFVAKYADWIGVITFKDASSLFFDGPKDLFKYYHAIKKYTPGRDPSEVDTISVKDYYTLMYLDGRKAFYVIGSDVYGPMGAEFIPFEKEMDAREFLKDHGGKNVLRFNEITPAVLKGIE
jgi:copper chaperone NosL